MTKEACIVPVESTNAATVWMMEDEEHMKLVLAVKAEVNLSPSAMEYFHRFAIERGWDNEEYGLQMEYLLTTALEKKGRTEEVYGNTMQKLKKDLPDFVWELAQSRRRLWVQEELEQKCQEFHCRAKQCHALDPHNYAGKPKEAHDQHKQKMMDT